MNVVVRLVLLAILVAGVYSGIRYLTAEKPKSAKVVESNWISSKQCMECHQGVWSEWHGSHHQIAYENPEVKKLSNDFRNKECQTCHLPRPIFETGITARPLPRTSFPEEGVSCLTCHLGPEGGILARHDRPNAGCAPQRSEEFISVDLCATCHNQHWTTDQYHASKWPERQVNCNSCHMEEVARGDSVGYHHGFLGAHDPETLRRAATVEAQIEDDRLAVTVTNVGAGHNFPTEERHRAVDVEWRVKGEDTWQRVHRFRMYYRDEGGKDDQLPSDSTWSGTAELPADTAAIELAVWYRLQPYAANGDEWSTQLWQAELSTDNPEWTSPPERPYGARAIDREDLVSAAADSAIWPPPQIKPFQALVDAAQPEPDMATLDQLNDLRDTGFAGGASGRVARMAQRSLRDDPDGFWSFEAGLLSDNLGLASQSAYQLGELGVLGSLDPLVKRLKYELDDANLVWVALALHRLGNDSGMTVLAKLMTNEAMANAAGQNAIQILTGPLKDALKPQLSEQPTYAELIQGIESLYDHWQRTGESSLAQPPEVATTVEGMDPLLRGRLAARLIQLTSHSLRPVDDCRFVFGRLGTVGLPMLRMALLSEEPYIRVHALEVLGELGPMGAPLAPETAPLLDNRLTATKAAHALGSMGATDHAPRLRTWLAGEITSANESKQAAAIHERRIAAAEALGAMRDQGSRAALRELMADPATSIDLAVHAAFAIAMLDTGPTDGTELEGGGAGRAFLEAALQAESFHTPTLEELIDRVNRASN